jgi:hypothetical protein
MLSILQMKNTLLLLMIVVSTATAIITQDSKPALADDASRNYIGPSINFGSKSTFVGIDSKFSITDNISLRPFISFRSDGTRLGTGISYDWDLSKSGTPIVPFIGVGIGFPVGNTNLIASSDTYAQVGVDFNANESLNLLGAVSIPFDSNVAATAINLGVGLRF